MKFIIAIASCLLSVTSIAQVEYIKQTTSIPRHPRILLLKGEESNIQRTIASDPSWKAMHEVILSACDNLITVAPVERIQIGRRLLDKSRECLKRVFFLSYAWRITHDKKYFDRAEKELLAVSAFSDWNPSHFLDVAEMTTSVAIGYDWLYGDLSPASRTIIREAIIKKGLEPSMDPKNTSWLKVSHNWNQVCNTGMAYGALAVYEDQPALSRTILNRSIESVALPMKEYGPDGAYVEGYSYWGYGTGYNVLLISMLEKAFGNDFGLTEIPGFLKTAGFMVNMTGPSHEPFNFFDSGNGEEVQPAMFWFASRLKDPSLLWVERRHIAPGESKKYLRERLLPAALIWGGNIAFDKIAAPATTAWVGGGRNPVAMLHSSWKDAEAIYVGIKGGSPSLNHGHMDVGSFVLDAAGTRWAMDFGMQNYESLESNKVDLWNMKQKSQRWEVFRYNNFAHNTLTVNGQLQNVEGFAPIIRSSKTASFINAVVDMKDLYKTTLLKAERGIAIADNRYVIVRDEIETSQSADTIRWNMVTGAKVTIIDDHTAELTKDGNTLLLQLIEPSSAVLKTWPTTPPHDYDAPNPNTLFIGFEAKVPANAKAALMVILTPNGKASEQKQKVKSLAEWPH